MIKKLTTFEIDEKLWLKFEEKRVKNIDRTQKYATMNKSKVLTELIQDFLDNKINIDLSIEEKEPQVKSPQAFHMPLEVFVNLEKRLNEEKNKYIDDLEKFQLVGTKKNLLIKLIRYYVQK